MDINDDVIYIPESHYIQQLYDYTTTIPIPKMTVKTKQKIVDAIPIRLRLKYSRIYDLLFDEVHNQYHKEIKAFSLQRILVNASSIENDGPDDLEIPPDTFAFKQMGKSANYSQFLKNRKIIQDKLLIVYPFIKYILDSSNREFPTPLIDLTVYQTSYEQTNDNSFVQFEMAVKKELDDKSLWLRSVWYSSVSKIIQKYYKRNPMSMWKWSRLFSCIEHLIGRQLTTIKMETFEQMLKAIRPNTQLPYVIFNLKLINCQYELNPSFAQLFGAYQKIIQTIMNIGTDFVCLEGQIDSEVFKQSRNPYLNIQMSETIRMETFKMFKNSIANAYAPIFQHVADLKESFGFICSAETQAELSDFFSMPRKNDEYLKRINIFREHMERVQTIVDKEHFGFAIVKQADAIKSLKAHLLKYIDKLTNGIIENHRMDCTRITQWLVDFETRALAKPASTEMLLANGEYMVNVKKIEMEQINLDIQNILEVSTSKLTNTSFKRGENPILECSKDTGILSYANFICIYATFCYKCVNT